MFDGLSREDRLLLLKFVCGYAWTDLEVTESERRFVRRLCEKAALPDEDRAEVERWLDVSPSPEDVDPAKLPREHRKLFLDAARAMIYADGKVDPDERVSLDKLRASLESE